MAARDAGNGERSAFPLNVTAALRARECTRGSVDSDTEQMMCTSCPTRVKYDSSERTYCCTPSGLSMLSSSTSAIFTTRLSSQGYLLFAYVCSPWNTKFTSVKLMISAVKPAIDR